MIRIVLALLFEFSLHAQTRIAGSQVRPDSTCGAAGDVPARTGTQVPESIAVTLPQARNLVVVEHPVFGRVMRLLFWCPACVSLSWDGTGWFAVGPSGIRDVDNDGDVWHVYAWFSGPARCGYP